MTTMLDRLTNKKTTSAALAERTAQERDQAAGRGAEIGALVARAAEIDEEIRRLVVAAALDGAQNDAAITKARAEHRAATAKIEALTERNGTALLVIAELETRHRSAMVDENTVARETLAAQYDQLAARIRALLLEAGALQERAMRVRHEEAELAGQPFMQNANGLPAPSLIEFRPLGPSLANIAEGYAAVDAGNHDLVKLMRMTG